MATPKYPKAKAAAKPKQDEETGGPVSDGVDEQPAEDTQSAVLMKLAKGVEKLLERVEALEERESATSAPAKPKKTPGRKKGDNSATREFGDGDEVVEVVRAILGHGDPDACEFEVYTEPKQLGVNFKLTMVPPDHLKEKSDDVRVKVIPYIEAISGAELYATKVRDYCVKWAGQHGTTYFAK